MSPTMLNTYNTVGSTSSVFAHMNNASPYGAVDMAGNVGAVTTVSVILDNTPPVPTLSGIPSDPTTAIGATITVSGDDVVSYRYSFDGGPYSVDQDVSAPILLSGLVEGIHILSVIAMDTVGNWQPENEAH